MNDSKHNVLDPAWEAELRRGQEEEGEAGSVDDELAYVHLLRHAREPEALAPEQLDAIWAAIEADVAPATTPWWRKAWVWWTAPALAAAAVLIVVVVEPGKDAATTVARHDDSAPESSRDQNQATPKATATRAERAPAPQAAPADLAMAEEESKNAEGAAPGSGAGMVSGAMADGDADRGARKGASAFEVSFAKLAPHGRLAIRAGVDLSRDELRSELLAQARGGVQ